MSTALIIGASRGIGRELARQYLDKGWRVLATARKEEDLAALRELGAQALSLDVSNAESCAALAWRLDGERLDVAILNAGVAGPYSNDLQTPDQSQFDQVMHTNVLAAMRLLPLLAPMVGEAKGRLVAISSIMASLAARDSNMMWLYRASKAALNSVLVDVARAYPEHKALCISMHPGWVKTDMGGPDAHLDVATSVRGIIDTLANTTEQDNGAFLAWDGARLPW
ncbi:SDR family oxidoreductase [Massilia sp. W12]|uniref:SDR family oxidoreductase n=1 Tax=Massilia sp. W12 TaxID=3126507 RepID=UPI0030D218C5